MQRIVKLKEKGYADEDAFDYAPDWWLKVRRNNQLSRFQKFTWKCMVFFTFATEKEVVMPQKSWSKAEEYIFSFLCIKQYVVPSLTVEEFLDFAQKSLPRLSKSSLKAKLSNVKHLLDSQKISNTIPLKPLRNFSKTNEDAIKDLIESFKLR